MVVENYRPDVKFRLGIDYDSLKAINPRIILASISGFGQDGPYYERPGFDQIAQGMSGLMSVTGRPGEGPMRTGAAIADVSAGLYAALGILTALLEREVSGQGQWVQSSLLMSGIALLDFQAARYLMKQRGAAAGRQRPSDQHADFGYTPPPTATSMSPQRARACGSACARRSGAPSCWHAPNSKVRPIAPRTARRSTPN